MFYRDFLSISSYKSRQECGHMHAKLVMTVSPGMSSWAKPTLGVNGSAGLELIFVKPRGAQLVECLFKVLRSCCCRNLFLIFFQQCSHTEHGRLPALCSKIHSAWTATPSFGLHCKNSANYLQLQLKHWAKHDLCNCISQKTLQINSG